VVFIEVGGTSTDITLIREGRVRHRYATVGGQRLMVPALDLRTVAVGGGSMLRADGRRFGPRSAHIAGLPYLFQALADGKQVVQLTSWQEDGASMYTAALLDDGSLAALTLTDYWLAEQSSEEWPEVCATIGDRAEARIGASLYDVFSHLDCRPQSALAATMHEAVAAIRELARAHGADLAHFTLLRRRRRRARRVRAGRSGAGLPAQLIRGPHRDLRDRRGAGSDLRQP